MHKLTAFSTFLLWAFLATACDDARSTVAGPTSFDTAGVSADVTAGTPVADTGGESGCPAFAIPLDLRVRTGGLDVALTDVTMRFVSSSGVAMPNVTLPAPVPTTQVGSDLIAARSVRTIPLFIPIGCTDHPAGTVIVVIGTRDGRGHRRTVEVQTNVR